MKIEESILPYLKGEKFSNKLSLKIAQKETVVDRIEYLCRYATGKKIIHVGCVDHLPLIREKIKNRTWLHQRLNEVACLQFGIDLNEEGINYIKTLGFDNVAVENILEGSVHPTIRQHQWDAVILGEILEHVENPVLFLTNLRERYQSLAKELVITVPNALAINNAFFAFFNKEQINSDHYYWFSPYTLSRILIKAGFTPLYHDFATYFPLQNGNHPLKKIFLKYLLTRNPSYRADLVYVARF